MRLRILSLATVASAAMAAPASAHHSFAMFDATKPMTMTGTVREFEWVNPHSWLRLMVLDQASGKTMEWAFELGSPVQQISAGWKADSVKPGDKVTVTIHPMKDGSRVGGLISATLPNGATLGNGGLQRTEGQRSSRFPGGLPAGIYGDGDKQPAAPGN